jgi:signal peptidase II
MADTAKKATLTLAIASISIALDQWTKRWARRVLDFRAGGHSRTVINNYFDLRYSENTGSAFGLFQSAHFARWLLVGIGVAAMIAIPIFIARTAWTHKRQLIALALVAGGTIGNVFDRVVAGRVSDFIVWHIKTHEWPAFNIADASLVIGVLLLAFDIFGEKKPAQQANDKAAASKATADDAGAKATAPNGSH